MTISLPRPIADYYAADRNKDSDAVAQCFSEEAIVIDENKTYRGRPAIRQWKQAASSRFNYSVDPSHVSDEGKTVRVIAHVVGDFPGSPVDLGYDFVLEGDLIQRLEIGL